MSRNKLFRVVRGLGGVLAVLATATLAQAQGSAVTVQVTEARTQRPIAEAQVAIAGSLIGGLTNAEGRFTLRGVPLGPQTIRVLRVGFAEAKQAIRVTGAELPVVEIAMTPVAVDLSPVVITATGTQLRKEVGNAVSTINVAQTAQVSPITTVADLLAARTSNLVVTTGTQTGAGSRTRIRGVASMSLSNEPIFIIDGVRMTADVGSSSMFTGGAQPSRSSDINPDEIEGIEIVKGPSAAALYGTAAANGVVLITTKRGRAGTSRWTTYAEVGRLEDRNTYPTAYTLFGKATPTSTTELGFNQCNNQRVGIGTCFVDSVAALNLFDNDSLAPFGNGSRYQAGAQLSGGTETVRYFISGEREEEIGVMELPQFEKARLAREQAVMHEWLERPNATARNSLRANLNSAVNPKLDLSLSSSFTNIDSRFSQESNATAGLGSQAFGGPGCIVCSPNRVVQAQSGQPPLNTPLYGYRAWTPGYSWQVKTAQLVNRFLVSGTANWRPASWWQVRGTLGDDFADRIDDQLLFNGEGPPISVTQRFGFTSNVRTDIRNTTADIGSTMQYNHSAWLNFKTTFGMQYQNSIFSQNQANGDELPPGAQTPNGALVQEALQSTTIQRTIGFFVEEAASINDRLFLSAAVRTDQNSAFGTNFQRVYYPKASLAWVLSDESFFPDFGWLTEFRYRAAYGASGVQPGSNDALRFFGTSLQSIRATDAAGLQLTNLGNTNLKPERSTEFETGFDAKLLDSRVNFEMTYYNKRTKDALINAIVAPSAGSAVNVRRNLGSVGNTGWEYQVNTQLLDRASIGWDMTVSYSTNDNKVISLGGTPEQKTTTNWIVEGYPIRGFWENPILGWEDKNGDGLITYWGGADSAKNEIFVGPDDVFLGYNQPRYIGSLATGFDFLNRRLRIQSLFDYRGGHKWYNNTERIRCTRPNCAGWMNPDAPLEEQAAAIAARAHPRATNAGYFQDGEFVRWRELSAQYNLSESMASRIFRSRSANVVASMRNVKLWTAYRGVDPEVDFTGATGDTPSEFQTLGPPTYFTIRFNLVF
jgi:TonB-linked SusC/RagA family outer membrane protein